MRWTWKDKDGRPVGHYEFAPFPACSTIVVSTHTYIKQHCRSQGLGWAMMQAKLLHARDLGYTYMICTVVETNAIERHILYKAGFQCLGESIQNEETGNLVVLYGKNLLK